MTTLRLYLRRGQSILEYSIEFVIVHVVGVAEASVCLQQSTAQLISDTLFCGGVASNISSLLAVAPPR